MAWDISITPEGWAEIYDALEKWEARELAQAICDDEIEAHRLESVDDMQAYEDGRLPFLAALPHDVLVQLAFDLIVQNNTCDNGGGRYWIDRQGCHKVALQ